jgi:hypothetical protein
MKREVPPIVAATSEALDRAREELASRFNETFADLHAVIPFVLDDVARKTTVCIALKGNLAVGIPAHWRYDAASDLLDRDGYRTLEEMVKTVRAHLQRAGVSPEIEFDDQRRIDAVGSFFYFR